jgi:hypothetical protein
MTSLAEIEAGIITAIVVLRLREETLSALERLKLHCLCLNLSLVQQSISNELPR